MRSSDSIARLGGDEFAVVLEDVSSPSDVELIADKMLKSIAAPMILSEQPEAGQTDRSSADMLMPVYTGTEGSLGIVQVDSDQIIAADDPIESPPSALVAGRASKLVSGSKHVAGIETDPDGNPVILYRVYQISKLLKTPAQS